MKKIITVPNKKLNKKCKRVVKFDKSTEKLGQDLLDTVRLAKDPEGAGLAAPQIGILKRVCVVRKFPKNYDQDPIDFILVNPEIIKQEKDQNTDMEGCLSIPDTYGKVRRSNGIKIKAQNTKGEYFKIDASGFFAREIQHEIDHLNGILFTSKIIGETYSTTDLENFNSKDISVN